MVYIFYRENEVVLHLLLCQGLYLHSFLAVYSKSRRKLFRKHGTFNTYTAHPRTPPFPQEVFIHTLAPPVTTQCHCSRNTVFILMSEPFRLTSQVSHIFGTVGLGFTDELLCVAASVSAVQPLHGFCLDLYWISIILNLLFYFCLSPSASLSYTRSTRKLDLECCPVI